LGALGFSDDEPEKPVAKPALKKFDNSPNLRNLE
jgi:hypothetical protein